MVSLITLFVIARFEFHNECVEEGEGEREKKKNAGKIYDFYQNQCLSTALRSPLDGERAFTRIRRPLSAAK